ncbi:D-2-hydroxyacid dehydrogenase [Terribacillus saccharophilus]|uniref:D-2-hydroxyacid dehydrogenase n=1 Tax=Terribacillus saccharophilus TaxID=361277 RepID=UPI00398297F1
MQVLVAVKLSEKLKRHFESSYPGVTFQFSSSKEETRELVKEAEVLVTDGHGADEASLQTAKKLKWIMVISAGVDYLPLQTIAEKGIMLTNANGIHRIQMAEYAISSILAVARKEREYLKKQEEHVWDKDLMIDEITAKKLVIVGAGAIGQEVARLGKAFRMHTIGVSRSGSAKEHFDETYKQTDIETVLPYADYLISILPSTRETKYFYKEKHFDLMPKHAVFLNMGRGDAVATEVLLGALNQGKIKAAVLDVFEEEPLPQNHPFWDHERVIVTPHMAGNTPYYTERAMEVFDKNLAVYTEETAEKQFIINIDLDRGY